MTEYLEISLTRAVGHAIGVWFFLRHDSGMCSYVHICPGSDRESERERERKRYIQN